MNEQERAQGRSGFTLVELMIVVAIIAVIAGVGLPRLSRSRMNANESAAIATLRGLATAEELVRNSGQIDTDADGFGEFGFFGELSGATPARISVAGAPALGVPGVDELEPETLTPSLGVVQADAAGQGVVVRSGYVFKLFLGGVQAGVNVPGVAEAPAGGAAAGSLPSSDGGERFWACYAWPVSSGSSGGRVFFMGQEGQLYQFRNAGDVYSGFNNVATMPNFDAALVNGATGTGLAGDLPINGAVSNDGNTWTQVN